LIDLKRKFEVQGQDENSSLFVNIEKMCKKEEEE